MKGFLSRMVGDVKDCSREFHSSGYVRVAMNLLGDKRKKNPMKKERRLLGYFGHILCMLGFGGKEIYKNPALSCSFWSMLKQGMLDGTRWARVGIYLLRA